MYLIKQFRFLVVERCSGIFMTIVRRYYKELSLTSKDDLSRIERNQSAILRLSSNESNILLRNSKYVAMGNSGNRRINQLRIVSNITRSNFQIPVIPPFLFHVHADHKYITTRIAIYHFNVFVFYLFDYKRVTSFAYRNIKY